jgi:hypothetical protein
LDQWNCVGQAVRRASRWASVPLVNGARCGTTVPDGALHVVHSGCTEWARVGLSPTKTQTFSGSYAKFEAVYLTTCFPRSVLHTQFCVAREACWLFLSLPVLIVCAPQCIISATLSIIASMLHWSGALERDDINAIVRARIYAHKFCAHMIIVSLICEDRRLLP